MAGVIKRTIQALREYDPERQQLVRFVSLYAGKDRAHCSVLDVGCGYGRNLRWLCEAGYRAIGVDVNEQIVRINQDEGLPCITPEALKADVKMYDVVLMSHIIEHFAPTELKEFMDGYLDHLRVGGVLIIATPLMTRYFYDDFDHVKPYQPVGISMVFGNDAKGQVQYYAKNKLKLQEVWFRKGHFRLSYAAGKYAKCLSSVPIRVLELFSMILFRFSRGSVGKTDGWVGVFKKVA